MHSLKAMQANEESGVVDDGGRPDIRPLRQRQFIYIRLATGCEIISNLDFRDF